jgi:Alcohol dehydrogenase GroES-like domain
MSQVTTPIDPGMASQEMAGSGELMRAGVYRGKGRVVVESVPIPEIGEGEVLFRVAACGICGTDIKKIKQGFVNPPQILGHEYQNSRLATGSSAFTTFLAARASIARRNFFRSARVTRRRGSRRASIPAVEVSPNMCARCLGSSNEA